MSTTVSVTTSPVTLGMDGNASITINSGAAIGTIAFTSANDDVWPSFTASLQSKTFGPFGVAMSIVITVNQASITYQINGGTGGYSYDDAGNVTGLVGPGGFELKRTITRRGMWLGSMMSAWQTTLGGYCWRLATELPSHARAFRIAVPKSQQGTWTVDGLAVCATDTAANPARFDPASGQTWKAGTFDRSTAVKTIPQFVPPDQYQANNAGDPVWSDWIYCSTIPRTDDVNAKPIIVVSVYSASVNTMCVNGGSGSDAGFGSEPMHRWDRYKAAQVSATGLFTSNSGDPQCVPIHAIEWLPTVAALAIGCFGDSIMFGAKTTPAARGYVIKTAATLSAATGYAVSSVNAGLSGDKTVSALDRFNFMQASGGGMPNIALFAGYSRNSLGTMTNAEIVGVADSFIYAARKYGVLPAIVTGISETATPAFNTRQLAINVMLRQLAADNNVPLIDMEPLITTSNAATYLDVDGIHPNNAGDDLMAAQAAATLLPWVQTSLAKSAF